MPRILAIDDKKDNLIALSALLKALIPDCEVITAQSGPEGIEKAQTELPDTILLDIKMPGMDGYEVCHRLKNAENIRHIPVIMLTALKTDAIDLVKGLETGADAYLAKPINEYVLAAQVKTALRIKEAEDRLRTQNEQLEILVKKRTETLRASEAQLRQAQKMEAISTLAGGIAHDFNNILTAIMGFAELAQMKLDEKDEAHGDLKQVLQSANRAKELIQSILAVGRRQEQEKQPMQLKEVVKEALKLLRASLPSTIEIQEEYDPETGLIHADSTQMHQVLMNLCTNAGHTMEENGGILKMGLRNTEFGTRNTALNLPPGRYLCLSVSDTGAGISPQVMEKIFDPYFTTKEKGRGTGIGLSVVHGIISQHGGAITVTSEPGKGSIFHVYFPCIEEEEPTPEPADKVPVPGGHERILFIDDEEAVTRMGKGMLSRFGYAVTPMTGSIEALGLFRENPKEFDLVITDTTMPHMPGDLLARELLKIRPDIPIIICTGHSNRISREKAKQIGIKGLLMKPLTMRELTITVRDALDRT